MPETKHDAVVADMLKVRANQQAGGDYQALVAEEQPPATPEAQAALPEGVSLVGSANDALIAARPAELASAMPRPGLSERGWSPEVTSRHPQLVADEMAAMVDEGSAATPAEPIDPNDPAALEAAVRENGFAEVRANNLRVGAVNRLNDRLSEGISNAANAGAAARAALTGAVEKAQAAVEKFRTDHPPAKPAPAATPAATPASAPSRTRSTE
jgi:hypothetical protein